MKSIQRTFIPGDKWLYIKIYTGYKTADKILINEIFYLVQKCQKSNWIDKWFFIRYGDPDSHLRVRLLMKEIEFISNILILLHKKLAPLTKEHLIWKIQLESYNRELNRYGGILIEDAESIFFKDSQCIVSILKYLIKNSNENYRWMIALKLIDSFLSDFSFTIEQKAFLMNNISEAFKAEFGFNEYNSKQFNSKYRENKRTIESVLTNSIEEREFISLYKPINKRSKELQTIINELNSKRGKTGLHINSLITGYLHMMMNRLFMSKNRIHELVIYDFMKRYYTSEIAKNKYNKL